jgi:hypothetical protein
MVGKISARVISLSEKKCTKTMVTRNEMSPRDLEIDLSSI